MAEVKPGKYAGGNRQWPADIGPVFAAPAPSPFLNVARWEVTADRAGYLGVLERLDDGAGPRWRAVYPDHRNGPRRAARWEAVRDMVERKRSKQ